MPSQPSQKPVKLARQLAYSCLGPHAVVRLHAQAARLAECAGDLDEAIAAEAWHCYTFIPACTIHLPPRPHKMEERAAKRVTFEDERGGGLLEAAGAADPARDEPWVHVAEPAAMDVWVGPGV